MNIFRFKDCNLRKFAEIGENKVLNVTLGSTPSDVPPGEWVAYVNAHGWVMVARNPELLGVGGAMRPSSGLRDSDLLNQQQPATQPASRTATQGRSTFRSQN